MVLAQKDLLINGIELKTLKRGNSATNGAAQTGWLHASE